MDDREAFLRPSPPSPVPRIEGFSEFYRRFVPSLVAFLMWQGARLPDAADVAQESMIQAYHYWSTIDHPQAWVRRVASRILARRVATVEEPVEQIGERTALFSAATNVTAWEQRHDVLRALSHLPSRQRQVMAWTLDGYRPFEIAQELRITPEAVRSNLKKARRALAAYLAESGEHDG
jgi:RNA polymerase sigma-70 factor (ECF subfamily)